MLARILEPEVMDTAADAADYDAMDHAEVNRRFVQDLLPRLEPLRNGDVTAAIKILDLGTGTAQIPIELCQRAVGVQVVGIDAAANMFALGQKNVATAGLQHRIELQLADAKRLPFADGGFDCVISNSIVHHLPEPMTCLAEAVRVVRSGGVLFFRDLMRPGDVVELNRLVDQYAPPAGISPAADHQRAMFSDSLHAALTLAEVRELVVRLGFAADSVQATSDRHWTWNASKEQQR